jgi:6,7-dimethyl-8-ribityllumazine synthase
MSAKKNEARGGLRADGLRFGVVVARFNSFITDRLLAAALDTLSAAGAGDADVEIVRVPGSFEIPVAAKQLAQTGRVQAILCIGCILRGETTHYDYVCSESARGIMLAQKGGNKGADAALAAIEMANLARKLTAAARGAGTGRPADPAVRGKPARQRRR